mgnify:FL=1
MPLLKIPANYYQQFDADLSLDVPGEGYGGWQRGEFEIDTDHTAVVCMHAWDSGAPEQIPGWYRAVEYIPRGNKICRDAFPELFASVRDSDLKIFHVVGGGNYYQELPGYQRTVELAGEPPEPPEKVEQDETVLKLRSFRTKHVFHGEHNSEDIKRGFEQVDFPEEARPHDGESIAATTHQLLALCKDSSINHLIYCGFAINWCLLLSPGGMAEMSKHGVMCSALRQATTAVENKETARQELCKEIALWRVSLAFGFVFDVDDFVSAIRK